MSKSRNAALKSQLKRLAEGPRKEKTMATAKTTTPTQNGDAKPKRKRGAPTGPRKETVPAETFVLAWRDSKTIGEVAKRLDMTRQQVRGRAQRMIKSGIQLPPRDGQDSRKFDVGRLNALLAPTSTASTVVTTTAPNK